MLTKLIDQDSGNQSEAIARLEARIEREKDQRLQERFLWVAATMLALDLLIFPKMEVWTSPVCIALLELVILLILARHCGIQEIAQLVDKVLNVAGTAKDKVPILKKANDEENKPT